MGKHVKVSEGRGILGAIAPFVVLVQGRCHVSYDDQTKDGEGRRGSGLGSMKLLGSGAKISDLLSFTSGFGSKADRRLGESLSPLTTPKGTQTITRGVNSSSKDAAGRRPHLVYKCRRQRRHRVWRHSCSRAEGHSAGSRRQEILRSTRPITRRVSNGGVWCGLPRVCLLSCVQEIYRKYSCRRRSLISIAGGRS